ARNRLRPPSTGSAYTMSAWVSPVCGLAFTMLSIFTVSTRFSEGTGSPVNGDRSWTVGEGRATVARSPPRSARSPPVTRPARVTTAAAPMALWCWVHLIAPPGRGRHSMAGSRPHLLGFHLAGCERVGYGYQRLGSRGLWSPLGPPISATWPHEQSGEWSPWATRMSRAAYS